MSALSTTLHWAILFPILTIFIGTTVVLTGVVRSAGGERWSILVPISGVLFIAGTAYGLAQVGAFCAFCE
jgi:Na+-driven multidrug efflux pump